MEQQTVSSLINQINSPDEGQTCNYSGSFTNGGVYEILFQAIATNPDWDESDDCATVSDPYPVTVTVVDLDTLTLTDANNIDNSVTDTTQENEERMQDNTLYVAEATDGTAQVMIDLSWLPEGVDASKFHYQILSEDEEVPSDQWDFPEGTFEDGFVIATWTQGDESESNPVFTVNAWYDSSNADEPQRQLFVAIVKGGLIPDFNHDRVIDDKDKSALNSNGTFHFWINDAAESGDVLPDGSSIPGSATPNYAGNQVNGHADLVNFFPVWVNIHDALDLFPPDDSVQYKLRQDDGAVKAVYTDLTNATAGDFLTKESMSYGSGFNAKASEADTCTITQDGVVLSGDFLNKIQDDKTKGILLIEGCAATKNPLVLEIWQDEEKVAEFSMPLQIDSVNKMYRWINLRDVIQGVTVNDPTNTTEPDNYPDNLCNGTQFVFVHGYSTTEQGARGWNAEIFKRLYQSGSRAMFTAVTWFGDDSKIPKFLPIIGDATPNYYLDVTHAFQTASSLAVEVNDLPGQSKCIAGHSLGNMVVSSAIVDYGLEANAYFMFDAAVAMEAYDSTLAYANTNNMCPSQWKLYDKKLWASEWCLLFDENDGRNKLTWRDRFGNIPQAYNFYSSTEDVLKNSNGKIFGNGIWAIQEMFKGRWVLNLANILLAGINVQGGWGFNRAWNDRIEPVPGEIRFTRKTPAEANQIDPEALKQKSFFRPFSEKGLYSDNGSALANDWFIRAQTLAEGIPALSFATGANEIDSDTFDGEFDMSGMKANGWSGAWHHCDILDHAYFYTYSVYDSVVRNKNGGLQ